MAGSVSIIICTRNRAESLRATLASIGRCAVPPDMAAELLVVDNGSTDHTAQVVREAGPRHLPVRCLSEKTPGLSHARNAGLRASRADMVLFTDDDVRVPDGWIAGMCQPILAGDADAVAGGVHFPADYEPRLSKEPFRSRRGWLASTEEIDPLAPANFVGANMAMSHEVVAAVGEFDPELGAGALGFCEESLFSYRLLAAGFRIRAALDVSVEHHFDLDRLTRGTLLSMAERMGRSSAYVQYHWDQFDPAAARSQVRRAMILLALERLKPPWKNRTIREIPRVQTLAYWKKLVELADQPRRYERLAA